MNLQCVLVDIYIPLGTEAGCRSQVPDRAVAVVTTRYNGVVATVLRVRAAAPPDPAALPASAPHHRPSHSVHVHSSLCIWCAPCHPVRGYTPPTAPPHFLTLATPMWAPFWQD